MNQHHAVPTGRTDSTVRRSIRISRRCLALVAIVCPLLLALLGQGIATAQTVQLITLTNTSWRFHRNPVDPGYVPADAWTALAFDDSTWSNGMGLFGREDAAGTALYANAQGGFPSCFCTVPTNSFIPAPGQGGPISTYFRTYFNWTNSLLADVTLRFTNYMDDSIVVYLNGSLLFHFNFRPTATFPFPWNNADPNTANPLGEGVPFMTNIIANLVSGTNIIAVQLQQQGSGSSDDTFTMSMLATPPTPLAITQEPVGGTFDEGTGVTLATTVTGTNPRYQWYKDTNSPVAIPGATNRTLVFTNSTVADTGDYWLVATNMVSGVTSTVAHLEIVTDVNGPVLLKVAGDNTFQRIILTWNEPVQESSATELGNYRIFDLSSNEFLVASVIWNGSNVVLNVPMLASDADYWIEINYQVDAVGNPTLPSGTPEIDPNGITRTFHTWVFTPGLTRFQAYLGATTIPAATSSPLYPNSGSFGFLTNVVNWPQSANPNIDNYVMRFDGLFVATESGVHKFNASHDDEMELRVYPGPDTNGAPALFSEGCCNDLITGGTLDVTLTAGQRYYYELLVHEGGGGDYAGIAVTLPSLAVVSPMAGQYITIATDPSLAPNAGISQQPQSITIEENHTATFQVTATNTGGSVSYQWQLNSGGGGFTNIPGANSSIYTTPARVLANSGDLYRALVYVPGRTLVSSNAVLTVITDTNPPQVLRITTGRLLTNVTVTFTEVMDAGSAAEPSNYELRDSGGNVIALSSPVMSGDNQSVSFVTPALTLGARYTMHVQDVSDAAGNTIAATDVEFVAGRGLLKYEVYATGAGNAVADLRNYAGYPNSPRETGLLVDFNSDPYWGSLVNTDPTREGYGARMSGWFIPPATTNYIFYNRSDDSSELLLSSNNQPGNAVKVQEETACCNGFASHPTVPIALVEGTPYYIELLYKEGTGGDFGQVAVKQAGDPTAPDSLPPIPGAFLSAVDPTPPPPILRYTRSGNVTTFSWDPPYELQVATTLVPAPDWKGVNTGGATTYVADPANEFDVVLDPLQAGVAGTGSGIGTLRLSGNTLGIDVFYSGLSGDRTADHIHAPAPPGGSAGVAYPLEPITSGSRTGEISGAVTLTDSAYGGKNVAAQVQDLRNGLWYINIHTSTFGLGEIRGQIEPAKVRFYRLSADAMGKCYAQTNCSERLAGSHVTKATCFATQDAKAWKRDSDDFCCPKP